MRSCKPAALLVSLATFVVTCGAQVRAQEFRIQDVTAPAGLAVDGLKPRTIAFLDRPSDELLDPDTGLIRFEDWTQARPLEKQFLTPFRATSSRMSRRPSTACPSASRKSSICTWPKRALRWRGRRARSISQAS